MTPTARTRWYAVPSLGHRRAVASDAKLVYARLLGRALTNDDIDALNAFDAALWNMAEGGTKRGEFSTTVPLFADFRGLQVPAENDIVYDEFISEELLKWAAFTNAGSIVVIRGSMSDHRTRARVRHVEYLELRNVAHGVDDEPEELDGAEAKRAYERERKRRWRAEKASTSSVRDTSRDCPETLGTRPGDKADTQGKDGDTSRDCPDEVPECPGTNQALNYTRDTTPHQTEKKNPLVGESSDDPAFLDVAAKTRIAQDIQTVFDHWVTVKWTGHGQRPKLNKGRRAKIRARLKNWTVQELCTCLDGFAQDDFYNGAADGKQKLELEYRLANDTEVERGIELASKHEAVAVFERPATAEQAERDARYAWTDEGIPA